MEVCRCGCRENFFVLDAKEMEEEKLKVMNGGEGGADGEVQAKKIEEEDEKVHAEEVEEEDVE